MLESSGVVWIINEERQFSPLQGSDGSDEEMSSDDLEDNGVYCGWYDDAMEASQQSIFDCLLIMRRSSPYINSVSSGSASSTVFVSS